MIRTSRMALAAATLAATAGLARAQCSYQQLVAGDVQTNLFNGVAVAMDGDYILTGAEGRNTASGTRAGEVYCFSTFGTTYGQVAHILPQTGAATDAYFGSAVALGGGAQWAVIGAPGVGSNGGAAYIFQRDLATNLWNQRAMFNPAYGAGAKFGSSVAMNIQGTIAVVGAPYVEVSDIFGTTAGAGRALVYVRNANNTWSYQFDLYQSDASVRHVNDFFGSSVGVDGTTAVIGCSHGDSPTHTDAGYITIWERDVNNQWWANGQIFAPDQATSDYFGDAVAISGGIVAVGAPGASHLGMADAGCAYAYRHVNGSWVYDGILHAADAAAGDMFGANVAVYGNTIAVTTASGAQKTYLFRRLSSGEWVQDARYKNPGAVGDAFGSSVAVGATQMVSGAWGFDTPNYGQEGCAYVYDIPTLQSDTCAGARSIGTGTVNGCTNISTVDGYSTCGTGGAGGVGPDAWFAYTAPATGSVTFDTSGTLFDTVLSVHSGCPGDVASLIACNDDNAFPSQLWSRVTIPVAQGVQYLVRVAGYNNAEGYFTLNVSGVSACYANCDGSTLTPILNVNDFICFQSKFAAGDPSANCDGSTTPPTLNVNDFICFQSRFAAGCP